MSRSTFPSWLIVLLLALGAGLPARAQTAFPGDATDDDPLSGKALAKGLRAAHKKQPGELRRALREAARDEYNVRLVRIAGGTDTPDVLLAALLRLLSADLALATDRAGRLVALQGYWAGTRDVEELTRDRVEAGVKSFTPADYLAARGERLLAEWRLIQELSGAETPLPGTILTDPEYPGPFATKASARGLRAAVRASPRALAQGALDATLDEYQIRIQRVRGGTDTPEVAFLASARRVVAGRALGQGPDDLLPILESHWQMVAGLEQLTWERVGAGVKAFTFADGFEARGLHLEAALSMIEARAGGDKPLPLKGGLQDPFGAVDDPLDTRDLARDKFQATRADPPRISQMRCQATFAAYSARVQRVRGGVELPAAALDASQKLLDADLALARSRAERLAALERHWARAYELETLNAERVENGVRNFTPADFYEARFARLQAELLLAEARAAKE